MAAAAAGCLGSGLELGPELAVAPTTSEAQRWDVRGQGTELEAARTRWAGFAPSSGPRKLLKCSLFFKTFSLLVQPQAALCVFIKMSLLARKMSSQLINPLSDLQL